MTLEAMYVKSQTELENVREQLQAEQVAHVNSLVLISRMAKGDVMPSQVTITEANGGIRWAFDTAKSDTEKCDKVGE